MVAMKDIEQKNGFPQLPYNEQLTTEQGYG
jgi:hypothetical protein